MAIKEKNSLGGRLSIILRDQSGMVLDRRHGINLITIAGKNLLAKYFTGNVVGKPELAIAVGGSSEGDKVKEEDTALTNQLDQTAATVPSIEEIDEDGTRRVVATVTAILPATGKDTEQEIKEAGILITPPNADPVLYNRVIFPVVTRTGNMEMTLTWEVLF